MADLTLNGTSSANADVEMRENGEESSLSTTQPDMTDPLPPPQAAAGATSLPPGAAEHLSTIQPTVTVAAAATPPAPPAATARPSSIPPLPTARPDKPVAHGGPTRQYLNQNLTPHLLEGMKYLAVYEPEKPLLWLSDFLRDRSKEVEGS